MTAIVAMIHEGKVWMGGDHLGSDGFTKNEFVKNDKVFKNGDFLIGYTTSFHMGQILQYHWKQPHRQENLTDDVYFYKFVMKSFIDCFKDNGYGDKRGVGWESGEFLVGWKGRLFLVENAHALECEKFGAVGSGSYHAIGALKALDLVKVNLSPEDMLGTALVVSHESICTVGNKYTIISED